MKSFAVLALAATALAAPSAGLEARTDNPPSSPSCAAPKKTVCCNGGILGGILCTVGILGAGTCNDQAYCCDNSDALVVGGLIALNALNCINVDIL